MPRIIVSFALSLAALSAQPAAPDVKFSFASQPAPGFTQVAPTSVYTPDAAYGFDLGSRVVAAASGLPAAMATAAKPRR